MKYFLTFVTISLLVSSCTFYAKNFSSEYYRSEAERAEALEKKGEYLKAIEAYQNHINSRLESNELYKNENPSFYQLLIGDLYLKLEQANQAELAYLEALEKKVSKPLCSDRIKKLGQWHEKRGDFVEAFNIVEKHRELDTLLFDLEIDRLHKSKVEYDREVSSYEEQ